MERFEGDEKQWRIIGTTAAYAQAEDVVRQLNLSPGLIGARLVDAQPLPVVNGVSAGVKARIEGSWKH